MTLLVVIFCYFSKFTDVWNNALIFKCPEVITSSSEPGLNLHMHARFTSVTYNAVMADFICKGKGNVD